MAVALSVNLNKIALLRNSREGNFPDPVRFGRTCLEAGAEGLTVHPRPDQRHIRPDDVYRLRDLVRASPGAEYNIEGNPFAQASGSYPGFMALVSEARPDQCTLVPDTDSQLTSDHGFDLRKDSVRLQPIIDALHAWGVRVSLFLDPDPEQITLAQRLGADRIELYTGPFAQSFAQNETLVGPLLQRYSEAAQQAVGLGLGINAGHDLNLDNLPAFIATPGLLEVSIGHALTVDALNMGMAQAVTAYLAICRNNP